MIVEEQENRGLESADMHLSLAFPQELHTSQVSEEQQVAILVLGFVLLLEAVGQPLELRVHDLLPLGVCQLIDPDWRWKKDQCQCTMLFWLLLSKDEIGLVAETATEMLGDVVYEGSLLVWRVLRIVNHADEKGFAKLDFEAITVTCKAKDLRQA